ncbi:MAG: metallophosphoesterase [Actinobacteria bacterium]|nr:metallophosphoesterase [Actinomycetota bacterium]
MTLPPCRRLALMVLAAAVSIALALSETAARASTIRPSGSAATRLSFAVIGDFGSGSSKELGVARRMCKYRRRHPFNLIITTGDNVYDYGSPDRFEAAFFDPFECLLNAGVRFKAALGNHDGLTGNGRPELDEPLFGMPARNYVVRRLGVRFVIANSNRLRRKWLDRALKARAGDRWTIVAFHHPVFSPGTGHGSTSGFRPNLPRLFRRRGVDLVLNGHDHIYAVSRALKGIRYVVTGGGGAGLYGCRPSWFSARCVAKHHFLHVTAGRRLVVRAVPRWGPPFHEFRTSGRS